MTDDSFVDELASRIAVRVGEELAEKLRAGWASHRVSPLGPRRHLDAVRRGALTGVCIGREVFSPREEVDALMRKLARRQREQRDRQQHEPDSDVLDLARELDLVPAGDEDDAA